MNPLARWLTYLAALGLTGAAAFWMLVQVRVRPGLAGEAAPVLERRTLAVARILAGVLLIAAILRLLGQAQSLLEPGESLTWDLIQTLLGTGWGRAWLFQAGLALFTVLVLMMVRNAAPLVILAPFIAMVGPLTGHATESPLGLAWGTTLHGVHQLGGGIWLGTLSMILLAGYGATRRLDPELRHQAIAALVSGFSPIALVGVGVAVLVGVLLAWQYVGSWSALAATRYGRILAVKVALLLLTAMLGAWNWRRVRPRLGDAAGSAALYRSATLELVVGSLLLLATAFLTGTAMPGSM